MENKQISLKASLKADQLLHELFNHCKKNNIPMLLFISADRKKYSLSGNGSQEDFNTLLEYGAGIEKEIRLAILNTSLKLI